MARKRKRDYRTLEAGEIIRTTTRLADRIGERFPDSGLAEAALQLRDMANETARRARGLSRPYLGLRTLVFLVAAAGVFGHDRNVLLSVLAKQAVARMEAEQANAAKSKFLATMSHELRTPLNSVIGYAELIEEEGEGANADDARKIRASARQLLGVIDVILDISKLESGAIQLDPDHVKVAAVLDEVREAAAPLAAVQHNTFSIREAGALGEAEIDHARVYQCLMQLVANAAKFTRDGKIGKFFCGQHFRSLQFPKDTLGSGIEFGRSGISGCSQRAAAGGRFTVCDLFRNAAEWPLPWSADPESGIDIGHRQVDTGKAICGPQIVLRLAP